MSLLEESPYKRILVTGASGLIGSRLCERFVRSYCLPLRALDRLSTRRAAPSSPIVESIAGDLLNSGDVARALYGCDAVVHLAHGNDDEAPRATANLVGHCRKAGLKRFVHISSVSVHGPLPGPLAAQEDTATIQRYGDSYCDSKALEEEIVQSAIDSGELEVVILRPTIVYGPWSPFVARVLDEARRGTITLIDGGLGICNAVFIDDVCDGIYAALVQDRAIGHAMFINGPKPVLWKEFIETFAAMVATTVRVQHVSSAAALEHWAAKSPTSVAERRWGRLNAFPPVRAAKAALSHPLALLQRRFGGFDPGRGADHDRWPNPGRIARETCAVAFSTDKARRLLGWQPAYDFKRGADVIHTWLRSRGG